MPANDDATAELLLTDNLRSALDSAFNEGEECIREDGGMSAFSIICTSDGFVVNDHVGDDEHEIYDSVRAMLAQEMPESYVFSYDGYVDLEDGRHDALVCEVAKRGDKEAYLLAKTYERTEDDWAFDPSYSSIGTTETLYPKGTKPIVSGLVQLERERRERGEFEAGAQE